MLSADNLLNVLPSLEPSQTSFPDFNSPQRETTQFIKTLNSLNSVILITFQKAEKCLAYYKHAAVEGLRCPCKPGLPMCPHRSYSVPSVCHPCCFLCPSSSASDPPATPKTISDHISVLSPLFVSIATSQIQNTATSHPGKSSHLLPGPHTPAKALVSTHPSENSFFFFNLCNKYINALWENANTLQSDPPLHPRTVNAPYEDVILYYPSGLSMPSPVSI